MPSEKRFGRNGFWRELFLVSLTDQFAIGCESVNQLALLRSLSLSFVEQPFLGRTKNNNNFFNNEPSFRFVCFYIDSLRGHR